MPVSCVSFQCILIHFFPAAVNEVVWEGEDTGANKADSNAMKKADSNVMKKAENSAITNAVNNRLEIFIAA